MVAPALQDDLLGNGGRGSDCGHTSGLQMKPFKVSVPDGICWSEANQFTELAGSCVLWAWFDPGLTCYAITLRFAHVIDETASRKI
jgi:hypothetical protein